MKRKIKAEEPWVTFFFGSDLHQEIPEEELEEGGPGSGNFGHAGRPGEVGGSAPDGEGEEIVSGHLGRPLKMFMGSDSASIQKEIGSGKTEFWFSSNPDVAKIYGANIHSANLRLSNPKIIRDVVHDDELADWVKVARLEKNDGLIAKRVRDNGVEHTTIVVFSPKQIVIKKHEELEEGGPGSGNWGHVGRPGRRGGSAKRLTETTTSKEIAGFPGLFAKIRRIKRVLKKKSLTSVPR